MSLAHWWHELPPLFLLMLGPFILFRGSVLGNELFYERDTYVFYYPLMEWVAAQWQRGLFPLWTPMIFGGYPIFADGEIGMLYPLNWLLFLTLPTELAFTIRRFIHFTIAAWGMYALLRVLGVGRAGATVGGISFSLGSFFVAQMHHENIVLTAAWLPVTLTCIELALHHRGRARQQWLVLAGAVFGMSALGLHVQALAMQAIIIGVYTSYRFILGPVEASWRERIFHLVWAPTLVVGTGAWIAAVQLIPLFELGRTTYRGAGLTYESASAYAQSLQNLPTAILPFLFRRPDASRWWTLWDPWETHLYLGIAPLILAGVAVLIVRRRTVGLFALIALSGLCISLADESPIKLFQLLWQLPGFSALRAPGRFSYFVVFGVAGLAALCVDHWLRGDQQARPPRWLGIASVMGGLLLIAGLLGFRWRLLHDTARGEEWVIVRYLSVRNSLVDNNAQRVLQDLVSSLDPLAPKNALQIALLITIGLIFLAWWKLPQRAQHWYAALVGVIMLDLLLFASDFHPRAPFETVFALPQASAFMSANLRDERVSVNSALTGFEPNRVIRTGARDVAGYSSLPSQRQFDYWSSLNRQDNELLDLWGVRYVVSPILPADIRVLEGTAYRPYGRLMSGPLGNPTGRAHFGIEPFATREIRALVSAGHAVEIDQGVPTAEVEVRSNSGDIRVFVLEMGVHYAEHAYNRRDVQPYLRHHNPPVVATVPDLDPSGRAEQVNVYMARFQLDPPMEVSSVRVRHIAAAGTTNVYGIGLVSPDSGEVRSIHPTDRAQYRRVYQDAQAIVLENTEAYPRAFIVPEATARRDRRERSALDWLAIEPFDARQTVVIEDGPFEDLRLTGIPKPDLGEEARPEPASVQDIHPGHVRVNVNSPRGGYLVLTDMYHRGWRVQVDGESAPLYLADFLFRGVRVPPGAHSVDFVFDPLSIRLGAALSTAAIIFVLGVICGLPLITRRRPQK
ncbi:MAG: YfhO family protein [Chloroflexota bacterium]